jgi:phosphatidylglycerol:prolipoprotein diacylglycerol transferase
MHPDILTIGPFTLHAFGVMMALGFLAAMLVMRRLARGTHRNDDYLSRLLVWLMLGGVAGARLAYVVEHWSNEFAGRPAAIFRIDQGGLVFYGGVIGAVAAILLFARRQREHPLAIMDLAAVALPLGHACGRLGCFLNGCCYGRSWHGPLAVRFPAGSLPWREQVLRGRLAPGSASSLPLVPTQLIELTGNLLLFALLYRLARRRPRGGLVSAVYMLLYACLRFATEFLRGDARLRVGALSIGQVGSAGLLLLGLALLVYSRRPAPGAPAPAAGTGAGRPAP